MALSPAPRNILIIDDDKALCSTLKQKLAESGYEVQYALNGDDGLEILKKHSFDLILLDLIMPEKDGFYYLQKFQEQGLQTPIVVLTNLAQTEDQEKAKQFGFYDYLVKPDMDLLELVAYIQNFFKSA